MPLIFDGKGYRVLQSSKEKSRHRAIVAAGEMKSRARRASAEDDGKAKRVLKIVEEASELAIRGTLDATAALDKILYLHHFLG
jgi:shikimate kinase